MKPPLWTIPRLWKHTMKLPFVFLIVLSSTSLWFFGMNAYKLYPSRLHYDVMKYIGQSTCRDVRGGPMTNVGDHDASRLWMDGAGRLGNSIFNFIGAFALAKTNNRELILTPRLAYYIQEVFSAPPEGTYGICLLPAKIERLYLRYAVHEPEFEHITSGKDIHICCFVQSWKYYEPYKDEVRKLLTFHDILTSKAQQYLADATKAMQNKHPVTYVGVHVRRGDLFAPDIVQRGFRTAPLGYFVAAFRFYLDRLPNVHFTVCSDDIEWCQTQAIFQPKNTSYSVSFSSGYSEGFDLALLAQCNHTIMSVGTYGWWGGWLAGGQVVYYKQPVVPESIVGRDFLAEDFFPPHWVGLMGDGDGEDEASQGGGIRVVNV